VFCRITAKYGGFNRRADMQLIFKRYEKKYLVTNKQANAVTAALQNHMAPDQYGTYQVQNLYFDTDNWDVICSSMEKPLYKEKLRMRCYGTPGSTSNIFLELKKKYAGEVNKRRIAMPISALETPLQDILTADPTQIAKELAFYLQNNPVTKKMYIAFHRTAYSGDEGLRVTFDTGIRYRLDMLDFYHLGKGDEILPPGYQLMEVKARASMPLWLSRLLSENHIHRISYSKYGTCFTDYLLKGSVKQHA